MYNNENTVANEMSFFEKATTATTSVAGKIFRVIHKIRCVCCFTSLLASLGIIMLAAPNLPEWCQAIILVGWIIGILSGIIAAPLVMLGTFVAIILKGICIGLCFIGIGAVFGFAVALIICCLILLFAPAIITIRYYNITLKYKY